MAWLRMTDFRDVIFWREKHTCSAVLERQEGIFFLLQEVPCEYARQYTVRVQGVLDMSYESTSDWICCTRVKSTTQNQVGQGQNTRVGDSAALLSVVVGSEAAHGGGLVLVVGLRAFVRHTSC